tara:strand:- start:46477 stop:46722 length:246 start_codon:yes stop_codon:yes gene_type:complete
MSHTVGDKDHWLIGRIFYSYSFNRRERIERRINLAIEEPQASTDPGFVERIREQAARKSLGLQALHDELEAANAKHPFETA